MKANYFRFVIKGSIIINLCIVFLFSQTFRDDSLAVRAILDSNNLYYIYVKEISGIVDGRINSIGFPEKKTYVLTAEIGKLDKLETLGIHDNTLTSLPDEIGDLVSLRKLFAYNDKLSYIPNTIGNLSKLIDIDLRVNQITELPSTIGNLKKLLRFDISANKLTELPPEIGSCDTLYSLRCTYNELTTFPDEICNLKNLWQIYASHNKLVKLPDSIGTISTLESLDFSYNKLTTLPESIVKLDLKNGIGLGWNHLDSVNLSPAVLAWLGNVYPQWHLYQHPISAIDEAESFIYHACKAGTATNFYWGKNYNPYPANTADSTEITEKLVWYVNAEAMGEDNPGYGNHEVATKTPNAYGLYDMAGNATEFCHDYWVDS